MPASPRESVLCRYHYDALDRLVNCAPSAMDSHQRFYCKTRLATKIQGALRCSIFQHGDQLLAQQQSQSAEVDTTFFATDQQRSVMNALGATGPYSLAYTPYGHRAPENGLLSVHGFNGEPPDPLTGHYHLGNGYRQYNPVLLRFNSPDNWSPFGEGGLNAYAYCVGDPVNRSDSSGHVALLPLLYGISSAVGLVSIAGSVLAAELMDVDNDSRAPVAFSLMAIGLLATTMSFGSLVAMAKQSRVITSLSTPRNSYPNLPGIPRSNPLWRVPNINDITRRFQAMHAAPSTSNQTLGHILMTRYRGPNHDMRPAIQSSPSTQGVNNRAPSPSRVSVSSSSVRSSASTIRNGS